MQRAFGDGPILPDISSGTVRLHQDKMSQYTNMAFRQLGYTNMQLDTEMHLLFVVTGQQLLQVCQKHQTCDPFCFV